MDPQIRVKRQADQIMVCDSMAIIVKLISTMGECLLKSAMEKDEETTLAHMRAVSTALAEGKAQAEMLSQQYDWPTPVLEEVRCRLDAITMEPMRRGANLVTKQVPQSWQERCDQLKLRAECTINQVEPQVAIQGWSLQDCQNYLVELEANVNGAVMAIRLNYNNPNEGSLDISALLLTSKARNAWEIVLQLRQRRIDEMRESTAVPPVAPQREQSDTNVMENEPPARRITPDNVGMATALGAAGGGVKTPHPDLCPWFYGSAKELVGFKEAWEDYSRRYLMGFSEEELVKILREKCMPENIRAVVREARAVIEIWCQLNNHFQRQDVHFQGIITRLLKTKRPVDETQCLAYYRRMMIAIQEADELGKAYGLLSPSQLEALLSVLPQEEVNKWRMEHVSQDPGDLSRTFRAFVKRRIWDLTDAQRERNRRGALTTLDDNGRAWSGLCIMGSICGHYHAPEGCSLFRERNPDERMSTVRIRRVCIQCLRHSDALPCPWGDRSLCDRRGCVMLHHPLLHGASVKALVNIVTVVERPEGEEATEKKSIAWPGAAPLCAQRAPLLVRGFEPDMLILFDWTLFHNVVTHEAATEAGLLPIKQPPLRVTVPGGRQFTTHFAYDVPVQQKGDGDLLEVKVVRARGVKEIATIPAAQVPVGTEKIIPRLNDETGFMGYEAGPVGLLIGQEGPLPWEVTEGIDPRSGLKLYETPFGRGLIITATGNVSQIKRNNGSQEPMETEDLEPVTSEAPQRCLQ